MWVYNKKKKQTEPDAPEFTATTPSATKPALADIHQLLQRVLLHVQKIDGCLFHLKNLAHQLSGRVEELVYSIAQTMKDAPCPRTRWCFQCALSPSYHTRGVNLSLHFSFTTRFLCIALKTMCSLSVGEGYTAFLVPFWYSATLSLLHSNLSHDTHWCTL